MRQAEAYRTRKTFRATHFADIIGTRTRRSVDQENLSMTEEQLERKIEFIVDTLAQVAVNDQKHDIRLSRLERIAKLMVRAGRRERRHRHEQNERFDQQFARVNDALAQLAEAQKRTEDSIAHTDSKLDALVDLVRQRMNGG